MTDAAFERDLIAYLRERGYTVSRKRQTSRGSRRLLGDHLDGMHRGAFEESCRACRFARTIAEHRHHTARVVACALCTDAETDYLYPSTFVPGLRRTVAQTIAEHHAAA